jgi:hypothetical protein
MLTLEELKSRLADNYDEITILEVLHISSEDLVERFEDRVEKYFDRLADEFEDDHEADEMG